MYIYNELYLPDGFNFLILLGDTTLGLVTELTQLGGQALRTLLFDLAALLVQDN